MKVWLPDSTQLELESGATGLEAAKTIGPRLAEAALAVRQNGQINDLSSSLADDSQIEIVTKDSDGALELLRHDAAHVLATAVCDLYPGTKVSIGPPIEEGFYYDFEFPDGVRVTDRDFERIEEQMRTHVQASETFLREDLPVDDAREIFRRQKQPYKLGPIDRSGAGLQAPLGCRGLLAGR
jgi:threonyl-tRNA synthetase